jgi:hypothetical protein
MALVLKKWSANSNKDVDGNFVHIVGRDAGLVSWVMALLGVDSTSAVEAKDQVIIYKESSLAGFTRRVIPYRSISSTFYGYHTPWKEALVIGLLLAVPTLGLGSLLALLYYFLNKRLAIGIVEHSGVVSGFAFKRSVIEGVTIDEHDAEHMIGVIRVLIENSPEASRPVAFLGDGKATTSQSPHPATPRQQPTEKSTATPSSTGDEEESNDDEAKELYLRARSLASAGQRENAFALLMEIIDRFPRTQAARQAKRTLEQQQ